jgi:TRAP-type C4-dicarboxylate transport system permease small subunit
VLEVTEHILFATPFLAMAWLVNRAEGHVRVDIVVNALAPRPKSALNAAVALIGVAVCGVGTYYAGITAWDHYLRNVETYGIYPIPKWTLIQIIALGFAMTTVEFARMFVRHVREWRALADDPAAGG